MAKSKKPSNAEHVAAFFAEIRQAVPGTATTLQWLAQMESRALAKRPGWTVEAEAYLQGLAAAGALSDAAAASCRRRLEQCLGTTARVSDVFAPLAWMVVVAAMALYAMMIAPDTITKAVFMVLAAAAGALWTGTRPWLDRRNNPTQGRWAQWLAAGMVTLVMPFVATGTAELVGLFMQQVSIRHFKAERDAFLADPQGFPMLRRLAREHYGVEVVLGDVAESWAPTTIRVPVASVALMELGPGYCRLSLHRSNLLRRFAPADPAASALWVQGVMVHELAHCLDISRDTPAFGQRAVGTRSVAPADAGGLRDIDDLVEVHGSLPTQLWREAVADSMAVGFWKLAAPDAAAALTASLRQQRVQAAGDKSHSTMCWIDFAAKAPPPSSVAALFSWADRLRSLAPCELPRRQAQAPAHAVQGLSPQR